MSEPLGILLLPSRLEEFEQHAHARGLLAIPRVIALEPPGRRTPKLLREAAPARQARRLKFPGEPRLFVLYHPQQYRLARDLGARYTDAELWYVRPDPAAFDIDDDGELVELDELARARAHKTIGLDGEELRARLWELGIISPRPFVPGVRIDR